MRPQSCKAKGRVLQQRIAADIMATFPTLSGNDVRSNPMGCNGEDIILSPSAERLFPYSIEAKNQERVNVWAALEQARQNCAPDRTPLVVLKRNREEPMAVIPWATLLALQANATSAPPDATGDQAEHQCSATSVGCVEADGGTNEDALKTIDDLLHQAMQCVKRARSHTAG